MNHQESNVTFLFLQHLVEAAWDDGDQERLYALSRAMDAYTLQHLTRETAQSRVG